jgi:hypothetical protein
LKIVCSGAVHIFLSVKDEGARRRDAEEEPGDRNRRRKVCGDNVFMNNSFKGTVSPNGLCYFCAWIDLGVNKRRVFEVLKCSSDDISPSPFSAR